MRPPPLRAVFTIYIHIERSAVCKRHSLQNPKTMTLTFPPRRRPALLALGATAILAFLLWRSMTTPDSENSFYCALLLAYSGYTASREMRYLVRRETLRLDSRGLTIDHHRFPGWRIRHLPWADVLDQHADADHLTLIWRDGARLRETRLNLRHTRNADFTATLARHLPRPVPWPPATVALQEPHHWLIGDPSFRTALHQYAPEALYQPLILVFLAIAALLLADPYSIAAACLIFALIAYAAWRSHRLPQRYRADLPRPYIRLDADGVYYWHSLPAAETHIPWAAIDAVRSEQKKTSEFLPTSHLHLTWRPYTNAGYLRHDELRIALPGTAYQDRDNRAHAHCDDIAARIRQHSPALGLHPSLPTLEHRYGP